eukprot:s2245_g11.t1
MGMLGDENPFQFDVNWTVSKLFKMALGAVLNKEVKRPQECLPYNLEMTYRSDTGDGTRGDYGWVINREYLDYNKDGRKKVKTIVPYHDLVCLTIAQSSGYAQLPLELARKAEQDIKENTIVIKSIVIDERNNDREVCRGNVEFQKDKSVETLYLDIIEELIPDIPKDFKGYLTFDGNILSNPILAVQTVGIKDGDCVKLHLVEPNGVAWQSYAELCEKDMKAFFAKVSSDAPAPTGVKPSGSDETQVVKNLPVIETDLNIKADLGEDDIDKTVQVRMTTSKAVYVMTYHLGKHSTFEDVQTGDDDR